MRKVEASFNANIPFKNNSIASFYHTTQRSEFDVTLNVSSKSLKLNFSQDLEALKRIKGRY